MQVIDRGKVVSTGESNYDLHKVTVGLGWRARPAKLFQKPLNLDLAAFVFRNNAFTKDDDVVFYNNLVHWSGAIHHSGDDKTGNGGGDAERIKVDLDKLSKDIDHIKFIVTIYDAIKRELSFGDVQASYVRIVKDSDQLISRINLTRDFVSDFAVEFGELARTDSGWLFKDTGIILPSPDLAKLTTYYKRGGTDEY